MPHLPVGGGDYLASLVSLQQSQRNLPIRKQAMRGRARHLEQAQCLAPVVSEIDTQACLRCLRLVVLALLFRCPLPKGSSLEKGRHRLRHRMYALLRLLVAAHLNALCLQQKVSEDSSKVP